MNVSNDELSHVHTKKGQIILDAKLYAIEELQSIVLEKRSLKKGIVIKNPQLLSVEELESLSIHSKDHILFDFLDTKKPKKT
jgi:hypothetical protein